MRRRLWSIVVMLTFLANLLPLPALAAPPGPPRQVSLTKRYIVKYKSQAAAEKGAKTQKPGAADLQAKLGREFRLTHMRQADLTAEEVQELLASGLVAYVEEDRQVRLSAEPADGPAGTSWALSSIDAPILQRNDVNGQGIRVAVLDTGIASGLSQLPVQGGTSVLGGGWTDDHGHGTQVASVIAASGGAGAPMGVAPAADLYAVKVLDRSGTGSVSDVLAGMEWAVENQMNVVVMAFGMVEDSQALADAVRDMYSTGSADGFGHLHRPCQRPLLVSSKPGRKHFLRLVGDGGNPHHAVQGWSAASHGDGDHA